MKRCIVTVRLNLTNWMPKHWQSMTDQDIIEFVNDSPEILEDYIGKEPLFTENELDYPVMKVERI